MFANFLVEHDLSFNLADHASNLFKAMFPDSKIADGFSLCRTKSTALVKEVLGPNGKRKVGFYLYHHWPLLLIYLLTHLLVYVTMLERYSAVCTSACKRCFYFYM